ncbi:metallophosphoesterase family protein [Metabacillus sp. RGM 3146]|uniref:metallophosphoesterase family protein n=1 Tax=Metabacillus sp. RGM 3146 TaxID=3401092 RepID=UPI003B9B6F74
MKVIVLSDTHMPRKAKALPKILQKDLEQSDLIIHAGDFQSLDSYYELKSFGKLVGVKGNVDTLELQALLEEKQLLTLNGISIGVVHGHGSKLTTEKRAIAAFEGIKTECIIFGHSHIPILKYVDGTLLFNPGSPTDKRRQQSYSYGILTLNSEIHAEHVFFDHKE